MSLEVIYTSAPRGLKPGSSGFATVAATAGMPPRLMLALEMLSGYDFRYDLSHPDAARNPANFAHTRIVVEGGEKSVLSRVAFAGADYSGRTNKIAHHYLLSADEHGRSGPGWMLGRMSTEFFRQQWEGAPAELPPSSLESLAREMPPPGYASAWQRIAGDAGWAGALPAAFRRDPRTPAFLIYEPGADVLTLFAESLMPLWADERWMVTFATYYCGATGGCHYHWRGVLAGTAAAREAARYPNATVIDLTRPLGSAPDDPYARAARGGTVVPGAQYELSRATGAAAEPRNIFAAGPGMPAGTARPAGGSAWHAVAPRAKRRRPALLALAVIAVLAGGGVLAYRFLSDLGATGAAPVVLNILDLPRAEGLASSAAPRREGSTHSQAVFSVGRAAGFLALPAEVVQAGLDQPSFQDGALLFQWQEGSLPRDVLECRYDPEAETLTLRIPREEALRPRHLEVARSITVAVLARDGAGERVFLCRLSEISERQIKPLPGDGGYPVDVPYAWPETLRLVALDREAATGMAPAESVARIDWAEGAHGGRVEAKLSPPPARGVARVTIECDLSGRSDAAMLVAARAACAVRVFRLVDAWGMAVAQWTVAFEQ